MKIDRKGQAVLETLVVSPVLILLLAAGGILSLCPLAVLFVEDHMEEALQCSAFQSSTSCEALFSRQIQHAGLKRWVKISRLGCNASECSMTVRWTWPKPLPQTIVRTLVRQLP